MFGTEGANELRGLFGQDKCGSDNDFRDATQITISQGTESSLK